MLNFFFRNTKFDHLSCQYLAFVYILDRDIRIRGYDTNIRFQYGSRSNICSTRAASFLLIRPHEVTSI